MSGDKQIDMSLLPAYCAYCDWTQTPPSTVGALQAHIAVCTFHPLRQAESEIARLRRELDAAVAYCAAAHVRADSQGGAA